MEHALQSSEWLVGERFSMADVALAPYVNRLAALAMERLWEHGRLPRVAAWFARVRARPTCRPSFVDWLPVELATEMRANGERSWPAVRSLLGIAA
jgi:glutathione S-transferase